MALSDTKVLAAYARSRGRCECTRHHSEPDAPHSEDRCKKEFLGREYWRPFYSDEDAGPEGIEVLCISCYRMVTAQSAVPA
jgi:hypothetical protein